MRLSRRQFNRGAAALSGAAAMPPVPLPMHSGGDDAYGAIVSELIRVEEAAHAAGVNFPNSGAVTATGRQLEAFLGHLDLQVGPFETAGQVYRRLRGFLKEEGEEAARRMRGEVKRTAGKALTREDPSPEPLAAGPARDDPVEASGKD